MKPQYNRTPFTPNECTNLPLGAIEPRGWLREQLEVQRDGFTGPLFEIWDDINERSAWLGGAGDAWERAPYYLDGLVNLAYTLNDEKLIERAQRYIEWIILSQREDGWYGPAENTDYWPLIQANNALIAYFTATNDKRILVLLDKFFQYEYKHLATHHLHNWAVARGGENMLQVEWMYNLTGQTYLLKLLTRLQAQTLDWSNFFHTFSQTLPLGRTLPWDRLKEALEEEKNEALEGEKRPYFRTQYHLTHGVNIAMGLKTPAVVSLFKSGFKEEGGFRFGWQKLMKYHGVANGMFTCDEHLSGASPTQGTETCTVVELMRTLETLLALGNFGEDIPEILEKVAYNALPGAFTADMKAHQYDQQVNQIRSSRAPRRWYNNEDDSNVFGFSPNFGCCTANAGQGWPRFVASLWYATKDGGLRAISYAPCAVKAKLGGTNVKLTVKGCYPFDREVRLALECAAPAEFPLYLRIPTWARQPMIYMPDGEIMQVKAGEVVCLRRKWCTGDEIRMDIASLPRLTHWYHRSVAVELGPLLMVYQPKENVKVVNTDEKRPEYEVTTNDKWNWALLRDEPMKVVWCNGESHAFGVGVSPVLVMAKAVHIDWREDAFSAGQVPTMLETHERESSVIELVPYGSTLLRIGQFPTCTNKKPERTGEIL